MNWRGHLLFGLGFQIVTIIVLVTSGVITPILNPIYLIVPILLFISPLLPDIDYFHSKLSATIMFIVMIMGMIGLGMYWLDFHKTLGLDLLIKSFLLTAVLYWIGYIFKHRGFTHSITFCFIYGFVILHFTQNLGLSIIAVAGCYSHLLADGIVLKIY